MFELKEYNFSLLKQYIYCSVHVPADSSSSWQVSVQTSGPA